MLQAIHELERRSQEVLQEKAAKRRLEAQISQMEGQLLTSGGTGVAGSAGGGGASEQVQREYDGRLAELEREREAIERDKEQVHPSRTVTYRYITLHTVTEVVAQRSLQRLLHRGRHRGCCTEVVAQRLSQRSLHAMFARAQQYDLTHWCGCRCTATNCCCRSSGRS